MYSLEQPVDRLALGDVGFHQHELVFGRDLRFEILERHAGSFDQLVELVIEVVVSSVQSFGGRQRSQCLVDLDRCSSRFTHLLEHVIDAGTGHLHVLLEADTHLLESASHVFDLIADLGVNQSCWGLVVNERTK